MSTCPKSSTAQKPASRIAPDIFQLSEKRVNPKLISFMMPFSGPFTAVYNDVKAALEEAGYQCQRADDMWVHAHIMTDIIEMICTSAVIVCDLSTKNPNVFYEAGVAHMLGKEVILISQSHDDVPFDLKPKHKNEAHRMVARLPGLRLALVNETGVGDLWDSGRMKELASRERMSARLLHKTRRRSISFPPRSSRFGRTTLRARWTQAMDSGGDASRSPHGTDSGGKPGARSGPADYRGRAFRGSELGRGRGGGMGARRVAGAALDPGRGGDLPRGDGFARPMDHRTDATRPANADSGRRAIQSFAGRLASPVSAPT